MPTDDDEDDDTSVVAALLPLQISDSGETALASTRVDNTERHSHEVDTTAVVALVDDTELLHHPDPSPRDAAAVRKQAWIHVVDAPELSPSTSIFAFVPVRSPEQSATADVSDSIVAVADVDTNAIAAAAPSATPDTIVSRSPALVIQIDPTPIDPSNLELVHAFQTEKTYAVPLDLPEFGWLDCFQLGAALTYTTMLLRRDISLRTLVIDDSALGHLRATQIALLAHAGLAFNHSTQSLTIRQAPPPPLHAKQSLKAKSSKTTTQSHKANALRQSWTQATHRADTVVARLGAMTHCTKRSSATSHHIGDRAAIAVFRALRVNTTLRSLTLQYVGLGDASMCALAAMLRCNATLTRLDVHGNAIGPLGLQVLCDALEDIPDSMLLHLDVSANAITDAGVPHLCRALKENETLVWLNVSWNQLTSLGLLDLLDALRDNFVLSDVAAFGKDCDVDQFCQNHESKFAKRIGAALRRMNDCFSHLRLTSARAFLPVRKLKQSRWVTLPHTDLLEIDALVIADLLPLNTKLLTLDLSDNPGIERWAILEVLASIQHCKTLQHVKLANTGLHSEVAEQVAELVAANETLVSITMHTDAIFVQQVRGCRVDCGVETMVFAIPLAHHFDEWILAKCFALNRLTHELNALRLPVTPAVTTGSSSKLVSLNLSGRRLAMYEVVFLGKKVFHHLHIGRLALNSCGIESYGGTALADAVRNHATLGTLELEHNAIGIAGGAAMVECVQFNASLTYLNLSWNQIGNDGAMGLRHALPMNKTLKRLDLRGNVLSAPAILAISDGLRGNACLIELYLRWNTICPRGAEALAKALAVNKTLELLDIEHHTMGETGARAFADMLATNATLRELNMKGDDAISDGDAKGIGAEQAQRIALALTQSNRSLTSLNIAQNQIGRDGVAWFSDLLKRSKTLVHLDLSLSGMDGKTAIRFFECLGMNQTLVTLNLGHNRISNEGMMACLRALDVNRTLQDLDVTDNLITEEPCALLLQKLQSLKRPLALRWLCLARNSMTARTYEGLRTLRIATMTIVLEEEKHRGAPER